jgi:hypothetical protein
LFPNISFPCSILNIFPVSLWIQSEGKSCRKRCRNQRRVCNWQVFCVLTGELLHVVLWYFTCVMFRVEFNVSRGAGGGGRRLHRALLKRRRRSVRHAELRAR